MVHKFESYVALCAESAETAGDSLSLLLSAPSRVCALALSLSIKKKKQNTVGFGSKICTPTLQQKPSKSGRIWKYMQKLENR